MDFLTNDLRSGELAPILLGYSANAGNMVRRFFHRYRLISHVFCEKVPVLHRFSITMKFHPVYSFAHDELVLTALEDFADANRASEKVLYLIPSTEVAAKLIHRHRERLESRFIIATPEAIRKLHGVPPLS